MLLATSVALGSVTVSDLRDWYWRGLISLREFNQLLSYSDLSAQGLSL